VKFSVKLHIEPGVNMLTHSVLLFLVSLIPPCSHWSNLNQPLLSLFHWPLCWPNHSGNICCSTHNGVLWAFPSIDATMELYLVFEICLAVGSARVSNIEVTMPVQPTFVVGNAFRCTILITFCRMMVSSSDSVNIKYLSLSSRRSFADKAGGKGDLFDS